MVSHPLSPSPLVRTTGIVAPHPRSHHLRNVCRAKQQLCQCQTCTNFKGYQRVLGSLPKLFEAVTHPPVQVDARAAAATVDAEGVVDGAADPPPPEAVWDGAAALATLLSFCGHEFKSAMVADALCAGALDLASCHPAAAGDDQIQPRPGCSSA